MSKKYLNREIKEFIVTRLAERQTPSDVAAEVKEKFNIEIKRQTAHLYDPTRKAGCDLSEPLKILFKKVRALSDKETNKRVDAMIQEMRERRRAGRLP